MKRLFISLLALPMFLTAGAQDLTILHLKSPQGESEALLQSEYVDSVKCADGKGNVLVVSSDESVKADVKCSSLQGYKKVFKGQRWIGVVAGAESVEKYADAMKAVCAEWGLPCFDASNKTLSGVDMDRYSFREKYCQNTGDISHLNTAGMILVEPAFEKFIAEQYAAFLAAKQ
jgi:hypothetical protein